MKAPDLIKNETDGVALRVRGLHKTYRQGFWGRRGEPAVADLSFEVPRGEVLALLGHNGAGKTTTLKAILGLVRPDAGEVLIGGVDARLPQARARVGYLPEAPYFHENLDARELLDFFGKLLGLPRGHRRERADACLEQVGMAEHAKRRLRDCSKGMRQRIGLAQALLGEPELLILDEPQSGLDPLGRRQVRDILLEQRRRGVTILFSSHIVPDVEAVADRVLMLRRGRLDGVEDLHHRPAVRAYRVRLAAPEAGSDAEKTLDSSAAEVIARDGDLWTIDAEGAGALGRILCAWDAVGLSVHDVQPRGGDLETSFLDGLEAAGAASEVTSC